MKSVALHNLGCKVNSYELDVIEQDLKEAGYEIKPFDQPADIYIINTCTVTNIADRKSRQMIHRAKKENPGALVVAVGCYVETNEDKVKMDDCIDIAIGNNKKNQVVNILKNILMRIRIALISNPVLWSMTIRRLSLWRWIRLSKLVVRKRLNMKK